jgi:hypothetical protein
MGMEILRAYLYGRLQNRLPLSRMAGPSFTLSGRDFYAVELPNILTSSSSLPRSLLPSYISKSFYFAQNILYLSFTNFTSQPSKWTLTTSTSQATSTTLCPHSRASRATKLRRAGLLPHPQSQIPMDGTGSTVYRSPTLNALTQHSWNSTIRLL